ncbi:MAG: penicillin-binding protein 1A [Sphingobacteriia bacterium]|nr:penicillin-binding protein 1A [Sphingobacteriia bacterium]
MYKRIFYLISLIIFFTAALGIATLTYLINYYHQDLPDYRQLESYNPPAVTRVYSHDGKLIAEYFKENRIFVPLNMMPKKLINAFIAAEDQNFYSHPGVDYTSVVRAIIQNMLNVGQNKSLVGGSTITQQVVKNFLLTNERTMARKVKEAILAFRITQVYSKDRIIELYLNQIYLGNGAYGVASAALSYFNKSLDQLTVAECAFLAGLPKAPSTYHPRNNYARAKARRDYVIDRMYEENMITDDEAKDAINSKIQIASKSDIIITHADYFAEEVRRFIAEKYGTQMLYEGGLSVTTSVIPELQNYAEAALKKGLINYDQRKGYRKPIANIDITNLEKELKILEKDKRINNWRIGAITKLEDKKAYVTFSNKQIATVDLEDHAWVKANIKSFTDILKIGDAIYIEKVENKNLLRQIPEVSGAMIALNPKNGKVLAMIGGFDYKLSEFNRATQAWRQPGSTFKPFVYLSALEKGYTPNMILEDGPIEIYQGPGLPMWRPKNYKGDFLGPITLRTGLEKSRNTITARISQMVGMSKVAEVAQRFGIYENPPKNFATILGSQETTLIKMITAFAAFANYGKMVTPSLIDYIEDGSGKTIFNSYDGECIGCNLIEANKDTIDVKPFINRKDKIATDERTAYQMLSILQGVVERGTAQRAKSLNIPLFGKTGTTNDSKDVWFVGGNRDIIVGTYIGYDTPRDLGQRVTGSTLALPVFIDFMENIAKEYNETEFYVPEGIRIVNIDSQTGQITQAEADGRHVIKEVFKIGTEPKITNDLLQNEAEADEKENTSEDLEDNDGVY